MNSAHKVAKSKQIIKQINTDDNPKKKWLNKKKLVP